MRIDERASLGKLVKCGLSFGEKAIVPIDTKPAHQAKLETGESIEILGVTSYGLTRARTSDGVEVLMIPKEIVDLPPEVCPQCGESAHGTTWICSVCEMRLFSSTFLGIFSSEGGSRQESIHSDSRNLANWRDFPLCSVEALCHSQACSNGRSCNLRLGP